MNYQNGAFIKKKVNFAQVSNHALRNDKLSLKAKGLYSIIQSYITLDNFILYKSFLLSKCVEKEKAFEGAWKELKEAGYLKQYRIRTKETNGYIYQYELLDVADTSVPALINIGLNGEVIEDKKEENIACENSNLQDQTTAETTIENQDNSEKVNPPHLVGGSKSTTFKTGVYNNTDINNTENNNIIKSIYPAAATTETDMIDRIKKNICYDLLIDTIKDKDLYNNITDIICDVMLSEKEKYSINKTQIPGTKVKEAFLKLNDIHIDYVMDKVKKNTQTVKNPRNYIIACLYNSLSSMDLDINLEVSKHLQSS